MCPRRDPGGEAHPERCPVRYPAGLSGSPRSRGEGSSPWQQGEPLGEPSLRGCSGLCYHAIPGDEPTVTFPSRRRLRGGGVAGGSLRGYQRGDRIPGDPTRF